MPVLCNSLVWLYLIAEALKGKVKLFLIPKFQ